LELIKSVCNVEVQYFSEVDRLKNLFELVEGVVVQANVVVRGVGIADGLEWEEDILLFVHLLLLHGFDDDVAELGRSTTQDTRQSAGRVLLFCHWLILDEELDICFSYALDPHVMPL
jgi:hypothetical protein